MPASSRSRVDLPAPLGPTTPSTSPGATVTDTPARIVAAPCALCRSRAISVPATASPGVGDLAEDLGRRAGGDRVRRQIRGHDGVGADNAALADRDAARDHDVGPAPDVVADERGPLRREALPRHGLVGVVEAVVAVGDEAAVGGHAVLADLHAPDRRDPPARAAEQDGPAP